jgi:hypothetical protein
MTATPIITPLEFLKYIRTLPCDELGTKLEIRTRKTTDLPIVATIALLGQARYTGPVKLCEVRKSTGYQISPSTMDGLVGRGLARAIKFPGFRKWVITPEGVAAAGEIESRLRTLIAKLTKS